MLQISEVNIVVVMVAVVVFIVEVLLMVMRLLHTMVAIFDCDIQTECRASSRLWWLGVGRRSLNEMWLCVRCRLRMRHWWLLGLDNNWSWAHIWHRSIIYYKRSSKRIPVWSQPLSVAIVHLVFFGLVEGPNDRLRQLILRVISLWMSLKSPLAFLELFLCVSGKMFPGPCFSFFSMLGTSWLVSMSMMVRVSTMRVDMRLPLQALRVDN